MKNLFFTLFLTVTIAQVFATTFRVNNNPGVDAPYTTFGDAHADALAGDTILVEPSVTSYGYFVVEKRLTIIGNGYYSLNSPIPQVSQEPSGFTTFALNPAASGCQLIGLTFTGVLIINSSGNVLTRCKFDDEVKVYGSNNIVQSNYFDVASVEIWGGNILFSNNLLESGNFVIQDVASNTLIENNTFFYYTGTTIGICNIYGNNQPIFRNNIFYYWYIYGIENALSYNNKSNVGTELGYVGPISNGNENELLIHNLFSTSLVSINLSTTISDLQPGSSTTNTGYYGNGDDIGAFNDGVGRPSFIVNGIPPFPTIYSLNLGSPNGNNLPITLGMKTNN